MKQQLILASGLAVAAATGAAEAPFQLSLTPDIAIQDRSTFIRGVSLGIWSENPQQSLALGIVNGSTGESSGFSWAFGLNYAEDYTGVHWAMINYASGRFKGWQAAFVNISGDSFTGLQLGGINVAQDVSGVQLGFVNYTEKLHGLQLGFVNIATDNPWFDEFPDKLAKGFPFVNWSF
jgi:hypothetical protein